MILFSIYSEKSISNMSLYFQLFKCPFNVNFSLLEVSTWIFKKNETVILSWNNIQNIDLAVINNGKNRMSDIFGRMRYSIDSIFTRHNWLGLYSRVYIGFIILVWIDS